MTNLDARVAELEEEVAELKRQLGQRVEESAVHVLRTRLSLPPAAAKILLALYNAKGRIVQRWALIEASRPEGSDTEYVPDTKLCDVYVCRIRHAIGSGAIESARSLGFRMTPMGMEAVSALLTQVSAPFFTAKLSAQGAPLHIPKLSC